MSEGARLEACRSNHVSSAGFAGATCPGGRVRKAGEAPLRVKLEPAQLPGSCRGSPDRERLEHLAREAREVGIARAHDEHGVAGLRLAQHPLADGIVVGGVDAAHLGGEIGRQSVARDVFCHGAARVKNLGIAKAVLGPEQRSEEHTSELQSHSDLVCRLLLEKKKKKSATL